MWKYYTEVQEDGGLTATWNLDFGAHVTMSEMHSGLFLSVKDKEEGADTTIGEAKIDMSGCLESNSWVECEGDLFDEETGQKPRGRYRVVLRLHTE